MKLELKPPDQAGPVTVGMTAEEAETALRRLRRSSGLTIRAHAGTCGCVEAVEVFAPSQDDIVIFDGIDLFSIPAVEVLRQVGAHHELVEEMTGSLYVAPKLLLALWRHESETKYFASALIARPGYYSEAPQAEQAEESDRLLWHRGWWGGLGRRRG